MSELLLIANAGDGTISTLRLHRDDAGAHLEVVATGGDLAGCGTFAVDAGTDRVFAAYKGDPTGIATLRLDRATGELTEVSRRATDGSMTYLSLARGGASLLGVSYSGGFGAAWPVDDDELGEAVSRFTHANLHCIVAAPPPSGGGEERVYAVALGEDLIAQLTLDDAGHLHPMDPAVAPAPAGSGPRHLVLHGPDAYLTTEFSGELIRYAVLAGGPLQRRESVGVVDPQARLSHSRFGADPQAEGLIWGADVHLAGRWAVTSERTSSRLTVTEVQEGGQLGEVVGYTPTEAVTRGFAVSTDGRYVVAVGEESTHAQLLELDDEGGLHNRDRVAIGSGANWVRFVP